MAATSSHGARGGEFDGIWWVGVNQSLKVVKSGSSGSILTSSGTGKFGRNIHSVHPTKGSVGVSRNCPIFCIPLLSQEQVKLRTSNFVRIFIASIGRKAH